MLARCITLIAFCRLALVWSPLDTRKSLVAGPSRLVLDLVEFHKNLTQIESITGNEKQVGEWLAASLETQGYTVERQAVSDHASRFNVLAWPGTERNARVLLSSHIDTVPPFYPYKHENGTISGRGSVDAKASVAAQIIAVNQLLSSKSIDHNDVAVLYVIGEETGGDGMHKANQLNLTPQSVIFGEPTEGKLVSGHKGLLGMKLTAKGKSAHSGYPWLGRSANEVILKALTALMQLAEDLPSSHKYGSTTFNIGKIEGGVAANVVAETATSLIAIRIAAGTPAWLQSKIEKTVHASVKEFLKDGLQPEDIVDIVWTAKGYSPVDIDHDVPGFEVITVNYGTDVPNFDLTGKDQKRYLYGPGTIFVAHSDHEALTEQELTAAVDGYKRIILHSLDNHSRIDL